MKTLSGTFGTFKLVVVVAIGVTSILTFRAFAKKPDSMSGAPYTLKMKGRLLKHPDMAKFKQLLDANEAIYCVTFRQKTNDPGMKLDNGGCTTQSTTSVDDATRDVVLVCAGAHATQQAGFTTLSQLQAVSSELLP